MQEYIKAVANSPLSAERELLRQQINKTFQTLSDEHALLVRLIWADREEDYYFIAQQRESFMSRHGGMPPKGIICWDDEDEDIFQDDGTLTLRFLNADGFRGPFAVRFMESVAARMMEQGLSLSRDSISDPVLTIVPDGWEGP